MDQLPLFKGAPEAMHLQCTWVHGAGWHFSLGVRGQFECWESARRVTYTHLSTEELLETLLCELEVIFGSL